MTKQEMLEEILTLSGQLIEETPNYHKDLTDYWEIFEAARRLLLNNG